MARTAAGVRATIRNMAGSLFVPGLADRLNIPNTADMQPGSGSFAIGLWFMPSRNFSGTKALVEYGAYETNGYLLNQFNDDLSIYYNNGPPRFTVANFFSPFKTTWARIWITFNASDSKIRVYRNGVLISTSGALTAWSFSGSAAFILGYAPSIVSKGDLGDYADLQLCVGSIPSDADITTDYKTGDKPASVIHRYKLNDLSGSTALDSVGANNGTLAGNASFVTRAPFKTRTAAANRTTATTRTAVS